MMPQENDIWARRRAEARSAEGRLDRTALVGKPVEEAKAWCLAHDFPVLVEQVPGSTVLSFMPGRVRLWVQNGIVAEVHLG
jgi:hypothetical protein